MIGLFIIMLVIGGSLTAALVVILAAMFWTGRIARPGSEAHRLHRARVAAQIASYEREASIRRADIAENAFRRAQFEANRQMLEAKSVDELRAVWDAHFKHELGQGGEGMT